MLQVGEIDALLRYRSADERGGNGRRAYRSMRIPLATR
jgi:hypothetical protein